MRVLLLGVLIPTLAVRFHGLGYGEGLLLKVCGYHHPGDAWISALKARNYGSAIAAIWDASSRLSIKIPVRLPFSARK